MAEMDAPVSNNAWVVWESIVRVAFMNRVVSIFFLYLHEYMMLLCTVCWVSLESTVEEVEMFG